MLGRRQLMRQEGTNGARNTDVKEQRCLGNEGTIRRIYRKSTGLEIVKRIARCTVGVKESKIGHCGGVEPIQNVKKETVVRGGAGNVKAPAPTTTERKRGEFVRVPLGTSAHKAGGSDNNGWRVVTATRRKQTTRGNTVPKRKRRRCKQIPRRKRNGDTPLGCSGLTTIKREQCGVPSKSQIILVKADVNC
jgi:hypothetical protein